MENTILIQTQVAAMNIDSLNSDAIYSTSNLSNGSVVSRGALSATAGQGELFTVGVPVEGSLSGLWMVYSPEIVEYESSGHTYRGLSSDPRDFTNIKGRPFNIFKPQVGDLIKVTSPAFTGGSLGDNNTYANAAGTVTTLTGAQAIGDGLSFKVLKSNDFVVVGNEHVAACLLECVKN